MSSLESISEKPMEPEGPRKKPRTIIDKSGNEISPAELARRSPAAAKAAALGDNIGGGGVPLQDALTDIPASKTPTKHARAVHKAAKALHPDNSGKIASLKEKLAEKDPTEKIIPQLTKDISKLETETEKFPQWSELMSALDKYKETRTDALRGGYAEAMKVSPAESEITAILESERRNGNMNSVDMITKLKEKATLESERELQIAVSKDPNRRREITQLRADIHELEARQLESDEALARSIQEQEGFRDLKGQPHPAPVSSRQPVQSFSRSSAQVSDPLEFYINNKVAPMKFGSQEVYAEKERLLKEMETEQNRGELNLLRMKLDSLKDKIPSDKW